MPVLPAMPAPSGTVDPAAWYSTGFYSPANPANSLEGLNGGLDSANYTSGDNSLPMAQVQVGSFAAAFYSGHRRWEWIYARQFANDGTGSTRGAREASRQIVAGWTGTFFLPWTASLLYVGFQAFCRQDATEWDNNANDGGRKAEFWDVRAYLDSTELTALYGRLPHGRTSIGQANSAAAVIVDPWTDPGLHNETRWRWFSRAAMYTSASMLAQGVHRFRATGWPAIFEDDSKIAKLAMPCGGVGILALR